ncbi:MAG: hypothetical protein WCE75_00630 [Terracidiphilus sp.]
MSGQRPERGFALGQSEGLQGALLIVLAQNDDAKFPVIGHQDLPVGVQILLYLLRLGGLAGVFRESLHFDRTAVRWLHGEVLRRGVLLELILREEPTIRLSGSPVLELQDRPHTRLEPLADFREQPLDCRVVGRFIGGLTGRANFRQFGEISLYGMHKPFLQQSSDGGN